MKIGIKLNTEGASVIRNDWA